MIRRVSIIGTTPYLGFDLNIKNTVHELDEGSPRSYPQCIGVSYLALVGFAVAPLQELEEIEGKLNQR